jgi:hypothetical protein
MLIFRGPKQYCLISSIVLNMVLLLGLLSWKRSPPCKMKSTYVVRLICESAHFQMLGLFEYFFPSQERIISTNGIPMCWSLQKPLTSPCIRCVCLLQQGYEKCLRLHCPQTRRLTFNSIPFFFMCTTDALGLSAVSCRWPST